MSKLPQNSIALSIPTLSEASPATTLTGHVTPGTAGAYSELIASTARLSTYIVVTVEELTGASGYHLIDIALGGAGAEANKLANLILSTATSAGGESNYGIVVPFQIPAGSRVSARTTHSATASAAARISINLLG